MSESENSMATAPPFPLWARESGLRDHANEEHPVFARTGDPEKLRHFVAVVKT
jgi:hypothetical protein